MKVEAGLLFPHLPEGSDHKMGNVRRESHFWGFILLLSVASTFKNNFKKNPENECTEMCLHMFYASHKISPLERIHSQWCSIAMPRKATISSASARN